jgi:integrase
MTISDAGMRYMERPGGVRPYDLWRLDQIASAVGDHSIAQAADAWSHFKRVRCGGLSPATVQRFRATFSAALNYLAAEEGFDAPKLPRGEKVSNKRVKYLTDNQADWLIAAYAPHVQPIAIMLRWQGVRIGEALRADWRHVNWRPNSIFIAESKNGEPRTVTMHRKTRAALHRVWVSQGSPAQGPVFLTNRGTYATACRRAGIVDFHVHDWRHHWASHCVMAGIDLETIRQEGGWKSLRMVERYATVSAAHRAKAMAKLK